MAHVTFSISLPNHLLDFMEDYLKTHCIKRSEVIKQALELLREQALGIAYQEASQEIDPDLDYTSSDGIKE